MDFGWDADYAFSDSKGRVWFTTNQSSPNPGIVLRNNGSWSVINFAGYPGAIYVFKIAEDNFGNLWFATEAGLIEYTGGKWYLLDKDNSPLQTNTLRSVAVDQNGNIWIGTNLGLYVYNPDGIDFTPPSDSASIDSLSVSQGASGVIARFRATGVQDSISQLDLQRAINPFKFWTYATLKPPFPPSGSVEMIDSSAVNTEVYYRIKEVDLQGRASYSSPVELNGAAKPPLLAGFTISQNYPNPFNGTTSIDVTLENAGEVSITVYNVLGQKVVNLVNHEYSRGTYHFPLDLSRLASGVYLCRVKVGETNKIRKLVLLK